MRAWLLAMTLLLAGCGFQLRGTAQLPFETIYIPEASAGIGLELKRYVRSGTRTRVVDDEKSAQAVLRNWKPQPATRRVIAMRQACMLTPRRL